MRRGLAQLARQGRAATLQAGRFLPAASVLATVTVAGCADISQKFAATASQMPYIGLPQGTPERPTVEAPYPAVHDMPPARNSVTLTNFEQKKLEDDLKEARTEQQAKAGMKNLVAAQKGASAKDGAQKGKKDAAPKAQAAPAALVPATSRASIY